MLRLADLLVCLRFFSRLPLPETARERALGPRGLAECAAMAPVAGAIIALVPAAVLGVAAAAGLAPLAAALLALATLVAVTGALHEDALADCADGFGGGRTREHKLEIMRDSRIGAFGTVALVLTLLLRAAALAEIMAKSLELAIFALVAVAGLSRAATLLPLTILPPARGDGLGATSAKPTARDVSIALLIAVAGSVPTCPAGGGFAHLVVAVAGAAILALVMCALAWRQIGGQTGDVAGATQQIVEIGALLVFAAGP